MVKNSAKKYIISKIVKQINRTITGNWQGTGNS
jgi:hypothetical protein